MPDTVRRGMQPADLFRLQLAGDAQISPDGGRVAFVRTLLDEQLDQYRSTIWLVPTAGGAAVQFTNGPKRDTAPRWSPDGKSIAFLSERAGDKKPQLYVMPIDGGEPQRLTDLKFAAGAPVWSPDGMRIAFAARVASADADEDGKRDSAAETTSKPARVITSLRYKSNGEGFVYDRRRHLFVVPATGGEARQITDGDWDDGAPAWSPDGSRLVFASARHEDRDYDLVIDLWTVAAEPLQSEPVRLTSGRGPCGSPAWSPDGATVAYFGNEYALDSGRNTLLYTIPATGGEPRSLSGSLDRNSTSFGNDVGPQWTADGRAILFGIDDHGNVPVYQVASDGTGTPAPIIDGMQQVTSLSIARTSDDLAFTCTTPTLPAEVFSRTAAGDRQLTTLSEAYTTEIELAEPQRFVFDRDGCTIDGWVMPPAGYEAGRRYPVLLNVHGGPHAHYGHGFFDEFQVQAGAGYAVVFTNPRGSQGYGEAFTRAVHGDWGGGDFADVMLGLDEALHRFDFLDPGRMGILGGSYGGFMTSWAVGHTNRFKAACSERAVNNTYTLFGTSDIGSFFSETQAGVQPWLDRQWFIDHSPLTYATQINTPLLILHAENDLRCPIEQGEELFTVLKKLRKEVLFVRFPDENHEMSRSGRPWHRRDRFGFILEWFAQHLAATIAQPAAVAAS